MPGAGEAVPGACRWWSWGIAALLKGVASFPLGRQLGSITGLKSCAGLAVERGLEFASPDTTIIRTACEQWELLQLHIAKKSNPWKIKTKRCTPASYMSLCLTIAFLLPRVIMCGWTLKQTVNFMSLLGQWWRTLTQDGSCWRMMKARWATLYLPVKDEHKI